MHACLYQMSGALLDSPSSTNMEENETESQSARMFDSYNERVIIIEVWRALSFIG